MTRSMEIPEAAVEAACRASYARWDESNAEVAKVAGRKAMRTALAAALPYLAPAEPPVIDREAVARTIGDVRALPCTRSANPHIDAVMELARPESEVKAEALRDAALSFGTRSEYDDLVTKQDVKRWLYERADELEGK